MRETTRKFELVAVRADQLSGSANQRFDFLSFQQFDPMLVGGEMPKKLTMPKKPKRPKPKPHGPDPAPYQRKKTKKK
jgi:hypothetical protein